MKISSAWLMLVLLLMAGPVEVVDQASSLAEGERAEGQEMRIQVNRGRLTVQLKAAPLKAVLEEIGRRAGIEMTIQGVFTTTISTEFHDLPLEEGLFRLLTGCGVMVTAHRGTILEQVTVILNEESPSPGQRQEIAPQERGHKATEVIPEPPARTIAAIADRQAIKGLFDAILHQPSTQAKLDAFREMVNSVQAAEVELVLQMLKDEPVRLAEWEAALAPLADVLSAKERQDIVRSLQTRANREYVVRVLEQVHQYKTMSEAEARTR
jgi:hypothetical protein